MLLGVCHVFPHESPEAWARELQAMGCKSTVFPVDYRSPVPLIDEYVLAARQAGICIAEVGAWGSPHCPDPEAARQALERMERQLELAEYVGARCCVNVTGGCGEAWYFNHPNNDSQRVWDRNIEIIQGILDRVKPKNTYYTAEIMQWMAPTSPQEYLKMIQEIDRERFAVHMDVVNLINCPWRYNHHEEVVEEAFDLLGAYVKSCHVKDVTQRLSLTVQFEEVPCGEGRVNFAHYGRMIRSLIEDTPVLLEHCKDDAEARRSFALLKEKM